MNELKKQEFVKDGFVWTDSVFDVKKCIDLYHEALAYVNVEDMWRSEEDYDREPFVAKTPENPRGGSNPGKGVANLLERCDSRFIEENEVFKNSVESIVGKDYEILLKKFVCGVPSHWIPEWLKARMLASYFDNLNVYLKFPYRDITYFRGIDYHMDIMDRVNEKADIITVQVYLQDVNKDMSPLHVIRRSHRYCRTIFPHFRQNETAATIEFGENKDNCELFDKQILLGKCGSIYIWTALTMHGTQSTKSEGDPRISLRYTIRKNPNNRDHCLIDQFLEKNELVDYRNIKNNTAVILEETKRK